MARPGFMFRFDLLDRYGYNDDAVLGAWLRLTAAASRLLNGGRFVLSRDWSDTRWMRTAGIDLASIEALIAGELARWDDKNLILEGYDQEGEDLYRRQAAGGKLGAAKTNSRHTTRKGSASSIDAGLPNDSTERGSRPGVASAFGDREARSGETNGSGDRHTRLGQAVAHRSAEHRSTEQAAAAANVGEADPRLAAVAAAGGLLDYGGEDVRPQWLIEFNRVKATPEGIAIVLRDSRLPDGKPIRLPSTFARFYESARASASAQKLGATARLAVSKQMESIVEVLGVIDADPKLLAAVYGGCKPALLCLRESAKARRPGADTESCLNIVGKIIAQSRSSL